MANIDNAISFFVCENILNIFMFDKLENPVALCEEKPRVTTEFL